MPIEDINRSCEGESVKARGNEPTTKDLSGDHKTSVLLEQASRLCKNWS